MQPSEMETVSLRVPKWWRPLIEDIRQRELLDSPSALYRRTMMERFPELRKREEVRDGAL